MSASTRRPGQRWPSPILAVALWTIAAPAAAQDAGAPPACPAVPIGRACQGDADCGPGGLCFEGVADGHCTVRRDLDCCPPGARRLAGLDVCVVDCAVDADCPARPARQCAAEGFCWGCLAPPADALIGAACATDDDCGGAGCLTAVGEARVEGGVCTLDVPAYCCPPGTGPGLLGGQRFCLPVCRVDADCGRAGWGCDHDAFGVCRPGAQAPGVDAGVADGGVTDGGALPDGGGQPRDGSVADGGAGDAGAMDAAVAGDAAADGGPKDARVSPDGRPAADRGVTDARTPTPRSDAAVVCADAGHAAADGGPPASPADDGCGCRATSGPGPTAGWVMALLLGIARRRRRR